MSTSGQILRGVGRYIPQRVYELQREKNHIVKISNALDSKSELRDNQSSRVRAIELHISKGFASLLRIR